MKKDPSVIELRKALKKSLSSWLPDNQELASKELALFDSIASRRSFLKSASFSAAGALLFSGCGSDECSGPPSTWNEFNGDPALVGSGISASDQAAVKTASNIVVDSDIMDAIQRYDPLPSLNSSDATNVKDNALLESFNPHIMVTNSQEALTQSGFLPMSRNYGIPEIVHLLQESASSDYQLAIYEKSNNGHHGLKETIIDLPNTSSLQFNNIVAANGSFHNRIDSGVAYSQKMLMLANQGPSISYGDASSSLSLYYQTNSNALLQPGVVYEDNAIWQNPIDLISIFKQNETTLSFSNYVIADIGQYHDGSNNSFLYGTICFDEYYCYGFAVTFNAITDAQPTVTFFAPNYLSKNNTQLNAFIDKYNSSFQSEFHTDLALNNFTIFGKQTFKPLAPQIDSSGNMTTDILFTFFTLSGEKAIVSENHRDFSFSIFGEYHNDNLERCVVSVATASSNDRVSYLFADISATLSFEILERRIAKLTFDISALPLADLWKTFYNQDNMLLSNAFTRFANNDGTNVTAIIAAPFYDSNNIHLGVTNRSVTITPSGEGFTLVGNVSYVDTIFEENASTPTNGATNLNGQNYQDIWFASMSPDSSVTTLAQCISTYNTTFDFHCAHNSQGVLRSYFIIRYLDSNNDVQSFLVGFNEIGATNAGATYASHTFETLQSAITSGAVAHQPPLPISVNTQELLKWYPVGQDGEVMYSGTRSHMIQTSGNAKKLVPNDGSQGNLNSYNHSSCDITEGVWTRYEQEKQVQDSDAASKQFALTNHQVHFTITNVYGHPVSMSESTYLEVRFSKPVVVRDYTDLYNVKTYNATRQTSLFFKSDSKGHVVLEVDAGASKHEKYSGANMMYRFLDASSIALQNNSPLATVTTTNGTTTAFEQCNISFNAYDRLSGTIQPGAKSANTISDTLKSGFGSNDPDGAVSAQVLSKYGNVRDAGKPNNASPAPSLKLIYQNGMSRRGARSITARSDMPAHIDPLLHVATLRSVPYIMTRCCSWFSSAIHWVSHAVTTVVSAAEALAQKIKNAVVSMVKSIADIAVSVGESVANAVTALGAAIVKFATDIYDAAVWLYEFIKMLLDMERCYEIGQQLKALFNAQFKPSATYTNNVYSILSTETKNIENTIQSAFSSLSTDVNNLFSDSVQNQLGAQQSNGKAAHAHSQSNATKTHYMTNQVQRSSSPQTLSSSTIASISNVCAQSSSPITGATAGELLEDAALKIVCDISSEVSQIASEMYGAAQQFTSGNMSGVASSMEDVLKTMVTHLISQAEIIATSVVELPLAVLNDSSIASSLGAAFSGLEQIVMDVLGLLFFFDTGKFDDMEDFAYFCFGFIINVAGAFMAGISGNFADQIHDGTLTNSINQATLPATSNARLIRSIDEGALQTSLHVCRVIDNLMICFADILNDILAFADNKQEANTSFPFSIISTIYMGLDALRMGLRAPNIIQATVDVGALWEKGGSGSATDAVIDGVEIDATIIASFVPIVVLAADMWGRRANADDSSALDAFIKLKSDQEFFKAFLKLAVSGYGVFSAIKTAVSQNTTANDIKIAESVLLLLNACVSIYIADIKRQEPNDFIMDEKFWYAQAATFGLDLTVFVLSAAE